MARRKKTQAKAAKIKEEIALDPMRDFEGSKAEEYLARFFLYVRTNLKQTAAVLLAVLVVGLAFLGYWAFKEKSEKKGLLAYEELMEQPVMKRDSGAEARAIEKLAAYEKEFSDPRSRMRVNIKKIELFVSLGKKSEAAVLANKIADELDFPDQRAFFYTKAGILFEQSGSFSQAQEAYSKVSQYMPEDNYIKAFSRFGEGRCLIKLGKLEDGRRAIQAMMDMKNVRQIEELRIAAAAFLISNR